MSFDILSPWLGIDFETTGLDSKVDRVIEVGAVLWEPISRRPLLTYNTLVWDPTLPPVSPDITAITGITNEDLQNYGRPSSVVLSELLHIPNWTFLVAHNAPFDRGFLESWFKRDGFDLDIMNFSWIDTSVDVPYPDQISTRKLTHLAAEHGFVNPFAHRALFDVLTMLKVLSTYDPHEIVRLARSPSISLRAMVTYDERELAKAHGFRWDGDRKWWVKNIKECNFWQTEDYPFSIRKIEEKDGSGN